MNVKSWGKIIFLTLLITVMFALVNTARADTGSCQSGCVYNGACVNLGTREGSTGEVKFCAESGNFTLAFSKGYYCNSDFECQSGSCQNHVCSNTGTCPRGCYYNNECYKFGSSILNSRFCSPRYGW